MKIITTLFVGLSILIVTQTAGAQSRLGWEVNTGLNFATQKFGDADLNMGYGVDGLLSYRFMPHTSVFGGWGWHWFTADDSFAGSDVNVTETGYTFGLEFLHPLGYTPLNYFLRAGGIYKHIEVKNSDEDISGDSDHGFGWQGEAGLAFAIYNRWLLKPAVRYHVLSRDINIGNTTTATDLNYVQLILGLSRSF